MGWFYYMGKDRLGPVDDLALRRLAANGYITPETLIENEQGQSAKAGLIRGLEFPKPNPPQPGTFGQTGAVPPASAGSQTETASTSQFTSAPSYAARGPVPSPPGVPMAGTGGYAAPEKEVPFAPENEPSEKKAGLLTRALDFDLARIVGELGTDVNVSLLKNFANTCKVYFWIFTVCYWLSYVAFLVALYGAGVMAALLGGVVVGFPLYFVGYFFLRIGLKYCLEVTKLLIRLNQFLEKEEAR